MSIYKFGLIITSHTIIAFLTQCQAEYLQLMVERSNENSTIYYVKIVTYNL